MNNKHSICLYAIVLAIASLFGIFAPKQVYSDEETIALCEGEKNTIRIYKQNEEIIMRAFSQQDNLVWLNTTAQEQPAAEGVNYSNIKGEQGIILFVPSNQESCSITIGNQPTESGVIITENMSKASVKGTITYREKIALPQGAVIKIKLLDVSRQDVPAVEISSQTITTTGEQVPIPFELVYDLSQIQNQQTYAVRAEIYIADKLAFTTTQSYLVITQGHGTDVNLILQKVPSTPSQNKLEGTKWLLEDLTGRGVIDNLQTTIEFSDDNRLGGNGGCNRYFSSYELNESKFKVAVIGSTQKMCSEAIMNQEGEYLKALEKAQTLRIEGPYLLISCEGYDQPLKFTLYPSI